MYISNDTGYFIKITATVLVVSLVMGAGVAFLANALGLAVVALPVLSIIGVLGLGFIPSAREKFTRLYAQLRWYHWTWLILQLSSLVWRIRSSGQIQESPLDAWAMYRIALVGLAAFILLIRLGTRQTDWIRSFFTGIIGLIALYCIVCLVSTLWSVNAFWTIYRAGEYTVDIILIAAILVDIKTLDEYKSFIDWVWLLEFVLLASVWSGVALFPSQATAEVGTVGLPMIKGVMPVIAQNNVGQMAGTIIIMAFTRLIFPSKNKYFYLTVLGFCLVTMIVAQSRSPIAATVIGLGAVLILGRKIGVILGIFLFFVVPVFVTSGAQIIEAYLLRGQNEGQIATLTGRTNWWESALTAMEGHPLGYGAYAGSRFAVFTEGTKNDTTSHLHNTWLEIFVGTSWLGVPPFLAALFYLWWTLFRHLSLAEINSLEYRLLLELMGVMALFTFRTMFSSILIWHFSPIFLCTVGYAEFLRRKRRAERVVQQPYTPSVMQPQPVIQYSNAKDQLNAL